MGDIWAALLHRHSWGPWMPSDKGDYRKRQCQDPNCHQTDRKKA